MARSISISISISISKPYLTTTTRLTTSSSPLRYLSSQSSSSSDQPSDNSSTSVDPLIKKLEDAIHQIIVRRSAPDWLPFRPGGAQHPVDLDSLSNKVSKPEDEEG
ncbi:hypothetical protein ACFE04_014598 [Oxalis oulophora]